MNLNDYWIWRVSGLSYVWRRTKIVSKIPASPQVRSPSIRRDFASFFPLRNLGGGQVVLPSQGWEGGWLAGWLGQVKSSQGWLAG